MKKFNNPSWNFYLDQVNSYAYWEKAFTEKECEKIIKIAKDKGLIKGTTNNNSDVRSSKINWLYSSDDLEFAFRKITDIVLNLNKRLLSFEYSKAFFVELNL